MKDERTRMKIYVLFCLLPPTFTYFALPSLPKKKKKGEKVKE